MWVLGHPSMNAQRLILTFATKILWTGSESSNTTKPKLGSFPPTPLVFMRSSTTFPKPVKAQGKSHVTKTYSVSSATSPASQITLMGLRHVEFPRVATASATCLFNTGQASVFLLCLCSWNCYLLMKNSFSSLSSISCGKFPTKSWWLSG